VTGAQAVKRAEDQNRGNPVVPVNALFKALMLEVGPGLRVAQAYRYWWRTRRVGKDGGWLSMPVLVVDDYKPRSESSKSLKQLG
jgi:hypothetical protein